MASRAPAVFISHGAPSVALDEDDYTDALARLGRSLGHPPAVVVVSAHWIAAPIRVTSARRPKTIHDFSGFDPELARIEYACPGAPALAGRIAQAVGGETDPERGLDHGVWVPLVHMFREATVPVVQVSLPAHATAEELVALGRRLGGFRDEGVVLVGSGGAVHNLRRLDPSGGAPPDWAREFDDWLAGRVEALDLSSILDYRRQAPDGGRTAQLAAPTSEHLEPLLFVLGAALPGDRVEHVFDGFQLGTLSLRCFALHS